MNQLLLKIFSFTFVLAAVALTAPGNSAASSIWAPPQLAMFIEEGLEKNQEIRSLASKVKNLKEEEKTKKHHYKFRYQHG